MKTENGKREAVPSAVSRHPSLVTRMGTSLKLTFLPALGAGVIRLLGKVLRIRTLGAENVEDLHRKGKAIIIAFWHGRQLMMPLAYRGEEAHILISQHRDGELIQRVVARFGFRAVRGSSTRGGSSALRHLIRLGQAGKDLVVTPDGPKGPRQVAQMGVIHLARATGLPIVPLTFGCSKKKSSGAGIALRSHTRLGRGSFSGACRCGCLRVPPVRTWRPSGSSWRRRSIASRPRRMRHVEGSYQQSAFSGQPGSGPFAER